MTGARNKFQGFTLVEMLITVSIFAIAFMIVAATFVGISRAQNKARATTETLNESSFLLEQIAREIKGKMIQSSDADSICLLDLSGEISYIYLSGNDVYLSHVDCTPSGQPLSAPNIDVNNLQFFVKNAAEEHPLTTIVLTVSNVGGSTVENKTTINFQTAVSGRQYTAVR